MPDELTTTPTATEVATETAIHRWQKSLDSLPDEKRAELEDHLRASLPDLLERGLSAEDAVLLAAARLQPAVASAQSAVLRPDAAVRHPVLRTLLDVLVCVAAALGCLFVAMVVVYALARQGITGTEMLVTLGVGLAICVPLLFVCRLAIRDIARTTAGIPTTA